MASAEQITSVVVKTSCDKTMTKKTAEFRSRDRDRGLEDYKVKGKDSPYSITERRVLELIPVLVSQLAGDMSHKPCGRLPLLSARPAVTPATFKKAATNFAA